MKNIFYLAVNIILFFFVSCDTKLNNTQLNNNIPYPKIINMSNIALSRNISKYEEENILTNEIDNNHKSIVETDLCKEFIARATAPILYGIEYVPLENAKTPKTSKHFGKTLTTYFIDSYNYFNYVGNFNDGGGGYTLKIEKATGKFIYNSYAIYDYVWVQPSAWPTYPNDYIGGVWRYMISSFCSGVIIGNTVLGEGKINVLYATAGLVNKVIRNYDDFDVFLSENENITKGWTGGVSGEIYYYSLKATGSFFGIRNTYPNNYYTSINGNWLYLNYFNEWTSAVTYDNKNLKDLVVSLDEISTDDIKYNYEDDYLIYMINGEWQTPIFKNESENIFTIPTEEEKNNRLMLIETIWNTY